jgi:hypothetical protein
LYDTLGNYTVAFLAAGVPPIIGALLMCFIYRVKSPQDHISIVNDTPISLEGGDQSQELLKTNGEPPVVTITASDTTTTMLSVEETNNAEKESLLVANGTI